MAEELPFWKEAGTDSIVLGGQVDGGTTNATGRAVANFGITSGSSQNISFATGAIHADTTQSHGTFSSNFTVHNNAVSFGFASTQVTIAFAGGGGITLQGGAFETASGTGVFTNVSSTTNTGNFGIAGSIPSFS